MKWTEEKLPKDNRELIIFKNLDSIYDLSQVRQDLRDFISGLGHTPMMSEQKSEIID